MIFRSISSVKNYKIWISDGFIKLKTLNFWCFIKFYFEKYVCKYFCYSISLYQSYHSWFFEFGITRYYFKVMRLGSRGILCAREIIATAALRGQAQLVQQLQRSYSASDINNRYYLLSDPLFNCNYRPCLWYIK